MIRYFLPHQPTMMDECPSFPQAIYVSFLSCNPMRLTLVLGVTPSTYISLLANSASYATGQFQHLLDHMSDCGLKYALARILLVARRRPGI